MKIAIIGATGKAGRFIMNEALERGHEVTAIVRDASKMNHAQVEVQEKDVHAITSDDVKDFDVVVNAFGAPTGQEQQHVQVGKILIEAMASAPRTRLLVVGGAGSLFVDEAKTLRVMDTPDFPEAYKATASNQGKNLADLEASSGIQWTFISPSAFFDPSGKRTGTYQVGKDHLLVNAKGESYVSYADYAIAILGEIEEPKHLNTRFTVSSEQA